MNNLVKFNPEDLEYFKFHFSPHREAYDASGEDNWADYVSVSEWPDNDEYHYLVAFRANNESANIRIYHTTENPAAVIADLRQIFSNFDEITLINEAI